MSDVVCSSEHSVMYEPMSTYLESVENKIENLFGGAIENDRAYQNICEALRWEMWDNFDTFVNRMCDVTTQVGVTRLCNEFLNRLNGRVLTLVDACFSTDNSKALKDIIGRIVWKYFETLEKQIIKIKQL